MYTLTVFKVMLNSFIWSGFLIDPLRFFYKDKLWIQLTVLFISFQSVSHLCIFLTLLYWLGLPIWQWIEVVRNISLVLDLREKESIKSFTFKFDVSCVFLIVAFHQVEVPLYSSFEKTFYREWMLCSFLDYLFDSLSSPLSLTFRFPIFCRYF